MTFAAWVTMITTMSVVTSFTLYFFLKVLRTPMGNHEEEEQL